MSVPSDTSRIKRATHQPFECFVCKSRFTRQENLKRHAALHSRSPNEAYFPCDLCSATFSRQDLRRRHMKKLHSEIEETRPLRNFTEKSAFSRPHDHGEGSKQTVPDGSTANTPTVLDRIENQTPLASWASGSSYLRQWLPETPTSGGSVQMKDALFAQEDFRIPLQPTLTTSTNASADSAVSQVVGSTNSPSTYYSQTSPSLDTVQYHDNWLPSPIQVARGFELYFQYVSHFVPVLHRPTFDGSNIPPQLALSMLSLAYHHGEDPACDDEGSGADLALRCFHRARTLLAVSEEQAEDAVHVLNTVQAYLLLEICAMMYLCGKESTYALRMHPKMVNLLRSGGLMQQNICASTTDDLESLWHNFVESESRKRTVYAVHQLDALYYQCLSMPRSISHLEIKHDLPHPAETWLAPSAAAWAHRQLASGQATKFPSYIDTVRLFLSPTPDLTTLPPLDPYGTMSIVHFLISSAREISGWCAMTGRISMDRFEPLRSSLEALYPFIHDQANSSSFTRAASSEAMWEIAMIELQMWSPSHTAGSIENSIDAILKQWTSASLGPWSEVLFDTSRAIQPHVDWYLRYLEEMVDVHLEPPWIALYAYKAFLVAWELLRGGSEGAMRIVGLADGDLGRAMEWARKVFGRRKRWQIGRLIYQELDVLAGADGIA